MSKVKREGGIKIILHILAWAVIIGLPIYSTKRFNIGNDFLKVYYAITLINGLIFYINYLFIVPRFFFQKRKYKYYISALILVVCFYFVSDFAMKSFSGTFSGEKNENISNRPPERGVKPGPPRGKILEATYPFRNAHIMGYLSTSVFLVFFSLGLRVLERQSKIEKLHEVMEKEKLNSELAFLKNQISPHFFFNTLNNIYSLISINPEDSQKAVLTLSKLMRYLLYESENGDTLLSHEIDFMNNYIDLMKLRTSDKVSLSVNFPEKYSDRKIAPLLFIPFIENAFKHGISYREKSFVEISMEVNEKSIVFRCSNSLPKNGGNVQNDKTGGIGLENVKKRLSLLFPSGHDLKINKTESQFDVYLEVRLS